MPSPRDFQDLALDLTRSEGAVAGLDAVVNIIQEYASADIPDFPQARAALDAWKIPYAEGGEPIRKLVSSQRTLKVDLPVGWRVSREGGGHHDLLDARGASRLHWHVHAWDPVSLWVKPRYSIHRHVDLSATEAVVHIYDGKTVIHTIPYSYPHARINFPDSDGTPYYKSGWPDENEGWTEEMYRANSLVEEAAGKSAREWLDANRPDWNDSIRAWVPEVQVSPVVA